MGACKSPPLILRIEEISENPSNEEEENSSDDEVIYSITL